MPPSMPPPAHLVWFYRRPCFWAALAALAGVFLACAGGVPPPAWTAALAGAAVLAFTPLREAAILVTAASLPGFLAACALAPPRDTPFREGEPLTLRGELLRTGSRPGKERPAVLQSEWRLTAAGWVPHSGRIGLRVPAGVEAGDLVQVSGTVRRPAPATNPGGSSPRLAWLRRGVHHTLSLRPLGFRVLGRRQEPPLREAARRLRAHLLRINRETLPPRAALIAGDLVIGDSDPPDAELAGATAQLFRDSGTIHLLVVSGTQVSLLLLPFVWLGWRFYRARLLFWGLGALAVGAYYLLTEGEPAVGRAAVMGAVFVAALALAREPDGENCLGIAALVLLLVDPLTALDAGFALSFAAVWGLVRLAPPLYTALGPAPLPEFPDPAAGPRSPGADLARTFHAGAAGLFAGTLAAQLAVAPVLALHFQRSSWSGLAANLPMLLVATPLLYTLVAHLFLASHGLPILAPVVGWQAEALHGWAGFFAGAPFGAGDVFPFPAWLLPLYGAALAGPSLFCRTRPAALAWTGCLAGAMLLSARLPVPPPPVPTLRAIDVGQGDAVLLQSPDGAAILVDGGGTYDPEWDVGERVLLPALRALRVAGLDAVVLTHPHEDHAGGLAAVLTRMPVGLFVESGLPGDAPGYARTREAVAARRIPVWTARRGDRIRVRGTTLNVLGPPDPPLRETRSDCNNNSLVLRWDAAGTRMLLMGDAEREAESALLPWGAELKADILKVGHHGSDTSSAAALLQAVRPRLAVLSCGRDNLFGHPAPAALDRLRAAAIPVARTDQGGMITVTAERGRLRVQPYAGRW